MHVGDILYLKSTGQRVVIVQTPEDYAKDETVLAQFGKDSRTTGIEYLTQVFETASLETFEEKVLRELEEMKFIRTMEKQAFKEVDDASELPDLVN